MKTKRPDWIFRNYFSGSPAFSQAENRGFPTQPHGWYGFFLLNKNEKDFNFLRFEVSMSP
jgi:hypothetical protein